MEPDETRVELPDDASAPTPSWWLHVTLFAVTCLTALLAGITFGEGEPFAASTWSDPEVMGPALMYTIAVMGILFAHEMGHYLWARHYDVPVSPPYFLPGIPFPPGVIPLMGTFGAFIRMELRPLRGKRLLDIAAWGPLAGFVVTVPVALAGMAMSEVRPLVEDSDQVIRLGDSLLMLLGEVIFFGQLAPGQEVFLHPLAMAGWTGGFLTALNLLPLGQLDGGHISYAVFGERFNRVAPWLMGALIVMGVVAFTGWLVIAALVGVMMGPRHPPMLEDGPVRGKPTWLAWAALGMFAVTFTPWPLIGPTILEYALGLLGW